MAKAYDDMASLAKSYEPDVEKMNNQILAGVASDLERQARMLLGDINALWMGYERSYNQVLYSKNNNNQRTGSTRQGFDISSVDYRMNPDGTVTMEIDLILDDGSMWHPSEFGSKYPDGHSFMLISEGWKAPKLESYLGRSVYRLTEFDGVGIISSLINSYNTSEYEFKFYFEGEEYGRGDKGSVSFTR